MASKVIGISFRGDTLERLDELASREGQSGLEEKASRQNK